MGSTGKILTVKYTDLTRSDDGDAVMSKANYKQLVSRNRITVVVRGGGMGREAEIDWSTLPERFRERYKAKYGDPEEAEMRQNDMLEYDNAARVFYARYRSADGSPLKQDKQHEYLINASVLNKLIDLEERQRSARARCGNRTRVCWTNIADICEDLRDTYGHTLPASRLKETMRDYKAGGYGSLVSKKIGNSNTTKITLEAGEWILAHKISLNPVYTNQQLFDAYNAIAPSKGWKPLKAVQTLLNYLERPEIKPRWYAVEQGSQRANNLFVRQNRTELPVCRDALWYVDGTKVNLFYKIYDVNSRKTKAATTNCIHVLDAYSEVFVGYHICSQETFRNTYEAIRAAAENVGYLPYELVSDNQSGFTSTSAKRWQSKLGTICHTTTPYNGKSKTIEHAFAVLQADILHQHINYTGGNITARSEKSRIDESLITSNLEALPTFGEFCSIYAECINEWNNSPHSRIKNKTRWQVYQESVNPCAIALDETIREDIFFIATEKASTFTARGIEITVDGHKYAFEPKDAEGNPDLTWRRTNTLREFVVEYDPHDLSRVRLMTEDSKKVLQFNSWAYTYGSIHRAMQDQVEGERSAIIEQINANKEEIVRRAIETRELQMKYGVGPESLGYSSPLPQGVSKTEFERIADKIYREEAAAASQPEGVAEAAEIIDATSLGQVQKQESSFDRIAALDRL